MNDEKPNSKRLYISGPIKGVDNAADNFAQAQKTLHELGFTTVNPFDVTPACTSPCLGESDDRHYDCFMRGDIAAMMLCDGVALLDGWFASRGARLEHAVALQVGIPVADLLDWSAVTA